MTVKHITSLNPHACELMECSMRWMDQQWDSTADLLWLQSPDGEPAGHHVRETCWYAQGLLLRGSEDDIQRACQALRRILTYQFDAPGTPYDGTWCLFPEAPLPPPVGARLWKDYDPNWREFIGATLAVILLDYEPILPHALVSSIDDALRKTIRGALARNLPASYTNIALMHAFLLLFTGERLAEASWISAGEHMAQEIHRLFIENNNAFSEFNAPTYYGVDFYALGLWCAYSSSPLLQQLAVEMETALWVDIARMYHADMQNMAGPFDRSYGMDMRNYATIIGLCIWMAIGKQAAPFPDITLPFNHEYDFAFAPPLVAVGVRVPAEVLPHLHTFQGERQIKRVISRDQQRIVTAWIGNDILVGGEYTSYSQPTSDQFHPATIHWKSTANTISWIKLIYTTVTTLVNAVAEKGELSISVLLQENNELNVTFQIYAPGSSIDSIQAHLWQLPDLSVSVETNAHYVGTSFNGQSFDVSYVLREISPDQAALFILRTSAYNSTN